MDDLRAEILHLEQTLQDKKNILFNARLAKIYGNSDNISNIEIHVDPEDDTWLISYTHQTDKYDPSAYAYNDDSAGDDEYNVHESRISFGKSKRYFIKGGIKLNVYRNSAGELRIINPDYEFDLDLDEQRSLIDKYAQNKDIPEWMAIKVMLYISDNKWDDQSIINHFSVI